MAFILCNRHKKNFKGLGDCPGYNDKLGVHECQTRRARLVGASKECFLEKTARICYNLSPQGQIARDFFVVETPEQKQYTISYDEEGDSWHLEKIRE
jgi:hypothetical protein